LAAKAFVAAMAPNSKAALILSCKIDMGSFDKGSAITVDQGKQLTLTADTNCPEVVLDGMHKGRFFNVGYPSSASLVLQGLTLRNGAAFNGRGPSEGGAVNMAEGALTIKDCCFESCTADWTGAIATGIGTLHATNTTFFNNSAGAQGGSISLGGSATISNCTFLDSSTTSGSPGGAVKVHGNTTITDSTFTGCSTPGEPGGAIYVQAGSATLTNCVFTDNTCNGCNGAPGGGAIYNGGTLTLEGCTFVPPANTSAGNNDLFGSVTFACPPGTKGAPVTLPGPAVLIKQLPPSTEIVHCT
jgi:hypothetical protein